ncbi:MAG: hypothetical protein JNL72_02555 [Flavipsychrobacter sp.]|nr:hypothetical protein [Flavipsychrobacter sp.]
MIELLKEYWSYILAFGAVIAFLYDKGRDIWSTTKKRRHAYDRAFAAVVRLYLSYLKHKRLYAEKPVIDMLPDDAYMELINHSDTFNDDLNCYKDFILKEADLIPEVVIDAQHLLDNLTVLSIFDNIRMSESLGTFTSKESLAVKRAQFYSFEKYFDDYFSEVITLIGKSSSVKKGHIKKLLELNNDSFVKEISDEQKEMLKRYFESLHRQSILPTEAFTAIVSHLQLN